jgi:cell wall-associated NlpC family hydrolase
MGVGICLFSLSAAAKPAKNGIQSRSYKTAKSVRSSAAKQSQAQPKLTGVWGWTTGSQTYLRVRPGAQTPPVAKVPRRTKLFVWGKYNGWYRVETTDNKFGWVYHSYINAPESEKLAELSHQKARLASNRTSDQTLYGSPQLLRGYYARYGASGALKGLEKQGVHVARSTPSRSQKVRTASYSRPATAPRVVRTSTSSTTRQRSVRTPDPTFNDVGNVRLSPSRPAQRDNQFHTRKPGAPVVNDNAAVSRSIAATNDSDATALRASTQHASAEASRKALATQQAQAAKKAQAERVAAEKLKTENARRIAEAQRAAQVQRTAEVKRAEEQQRLAEAKRVAEAQRVAADAKRAAQAKYLADVQRAAEVKRAAEAQRVAGAQAAYEARRKAATLRASRRAAARQARRARQQRLAQEKAQQRARLRASMGAATLEPPTALPGIHPLTPEELLRAREDYISSRHKTRPLESQQPAALQPSSATDESATVSTSLFTPSSATDVPNWTPYVVVSAYRRPLTPLTQPLNVPQDASETPISTLTLPSITSVDRILLAKATTVKGKTAKSHVATTRTAKFPVAQAQAKVTVSKKTVAKTAAAKKAQARSAKLTPRTGSRGGSPRDYVYYAMRNGAADDTFGQVMANQALSYRGAPYIRGATSPSRGFDCSGLVYYLLRQRGYNPPRTAAGLAGYGKSVSRSNMKAGDIVLFANTYKRGVSHVGIYMGEGKFVHGRTFRCRCARRFAFIEVLRRQVLGCTPGEVDWITKKNSEYSMSTRCSFLLS